MRSSWGTAQVNAGRCRRTESTSGFRRPGIEDRPSPDRRSGGQTRSTDCTGFFRCRYTVSILEWVASDQTYEIERVVRIALEGGGCVRGALGSEVMWGLAGARNRISTFTASRCSGRVGEPAIISSSAGPSPTTQISSLPVHRGTLVGGSCSGKHGTALCSFGSPFAAPCRRCVHESVSQRKRPGSSASRVSLALALTSSSGSLISSSQN